jgi:hypothetical protein
MARRQGIEPALLPKPPLLITESSDEYDAIRDALAREIEPRGVIERLYVEDIAFIVWETLRIRRCTAVIINSAFRTALSQLLEQFLTEPGQVFDFGPKEEAETLALGWFTNQEARKKILRLLNQFKLDESAIEAEAIRTVSSELEILDRRLTSLEWRRTKALRCIADYRDSLALRLRESADRMIEDKDVLGLEDSSSRKPAAA